MEINAQTQVRAIVNVLGKDRFGIVAKVSTLLALHEVNILDISQTILQDIFTMTMFVDLENCTIEFSELQDALRELGQELHVQITLQKEDVFSYMHRI